MVATIQLRPGVREAFLTEFRKIVPDVLKENGCIEYGPTVDMATDLANQHCDDCRVTILEKWDSLESLKAHLVAPHMTDYRPRVKDFVLSSELRVLEVC